MNKDLLPKEGLWYKANLHCHTTLSDGRYTAEEIKKFYQEQGYSIIAYTDHDTYAYHKELSDEKFIAIAALEREIYQKEACPVFDHKKTYHFNFFDTNPELRREEKINKNMPEEKYDDIDYINQYIKEMNELGFLSCYNHPYWSLQTHEDYKDLKGLWGMEIYNYGCEVEGLYGYNPQSYDEMLRFGQRLFCVATDDNHNVESFDHPLSDSFGGYVMIKSTAFTYEAIIEALAAGEFYSSMGPEIYEFSLEGDKIKVKTSPVEKIFVSTQGRACLRKAAKPGETITEAEFTITGKEKYIRLNIKDHQGRHANSNAYFIS